MKRTLGELLKGIAKFKKEHEEFVVCGLSNDTRNVKQGDLFIFKEGENFDSHLQYKELEGVVSAFISEKKLDTSTPYVVVENTDEIAAKIASRFYGNPTKYMTNIAITGTNGKTSVSYLTAHILNSNKDKVGVIGTNGVYLRDYKLDQNESTPTTPPPLLMQKIASQIKKLGGTHKVAEVTSHALYFNRAGSIPYKYRVFTNLTEDHLDFHKSMKEYLEQKKKLFSQSGKEDYCIINRDSEYYEEIKRASNGIVVSYGTHQEADVRATNVTLTEKGTAFTLSYKGERCEVYSHLIGDFNIENLLSAITVGLLEGLPVARISKSIESFYGIDGRMERIDDNRRNVYIDFSHTPDALENALKTLRDVTEERLIVVFGAGGDRDKSKRRLMGEVSEKYADVIVITSDNPRTEDPGSIIKDITSGMKTDKYYKVVDRREAIEKAIELSNPDDVILFAGRGNETEQEVGLKKVPFSDMGVTKTILSTT